MDNSGYVDSENSKEGENIEQQNNNNEPSDENDTQKQGLNDGTENQMENEQEIIIPIESENEMELRQRKLPQNGDVITNDVKTMNKENMKKEGVDSTSRFKLWAKNNKVQIRIGALIILNLAIFGYFFAATNYWYNSAVVNREWEFCDGYGMLLILMSIIYFFVVYFYIVKPFFGKALSALILTPINNIYLKLWKFWYMRVILGVVILGSIITFLIVDTYDSRERLISLIGLVFLLLFGYVFSRSRSQIIWRPVIWGVTLQFIMGLFTMRWSVGRQIFQCIGDKVAAFLLFSNAGSSFVFSDFLVSEIGVFGFQVLPVIFFFSLIIEVMFYLGAMQWICIKLGWCLQVTMGTTVCESVICAANTFLGMTESPLLIKPYMADLTKSEVHAIMGSGFATVSGTVLAAYISFGVQPAHLITASVMSAPAALCYAKLFYPETEKSNTAVDTIQIVTSSHTSILDAAARGASDGIFLVLNIAANLIAFVSLIAFLNGIIGWLGMLVGWDFLNLEWIFGKVFIPLSWIMGVPWEECEYVGNLIGLKTVVNEFVAYQRLGEYKLAGLLSARGEAIATFALCGFTNPSSIGIMVGALSAMAPTRRSDIANVAVRAFITACAVCFMTACIAGLLITPGAFEDIITNSTAVANSSHLLFQMTQL